MQSKCADSVAAARSLFPAGRGGSIPTSALNLRFSKCNSKRAARLNQLWHSKQPIIGAVNTLNPCFVASFDGEFYAVAIWSNPVARELPQKTWLELRRFAIAPDRPHNTASRMLAWMVKEIHRSRPHVAKLISYQDADEHTGTIYRAAGWKPVYLSKSGGAWSNRQRRNRTARRRKNKVRWELSLILRSKVRMQNAK